MNAEKIDPKISAHSFILRAKRYNFGQFPFSDSDPSKYYPGDLAILAIRTKPFQLAQQVWRRRYYRKNSTTPYSSQGFTKIGDTSDQDGTFVNWAEIPNDPELFGDYVDIYHVPRERGETYILSFSICSFDEKENLLKELDKVSKEVKEVNQKVLQLL